MQELILLGLGQQLERQLCAMLTLACLAVILIHLPLRATKAVSPHLLPIQLSLTTPLGDSNLLFFNYLLPLMISRLNVRCAQKYFHLLSVRGRQRKLKAGNQCNMASRCKKNSSGVLAVV